jgi:nitric oxide reductase NorD protein
VRTAPPPEQISAWRKQLDCGFPQIADVFEDCMVEAQTLLTPEGLNAYLKAGHFLGKMGRGVEPVLIFLQEWPQVAAILGEQALDAIMEAIHALTRSPNGDAIAPFLQSLAAIARRLPSQTQMQHHLDLTLRYMDRTSISIHGIHKTYASPSLPDFFLQSPHLLNQLSIEGLSNWVDYGVRNYNHHPERQREYFSLQSADSRAVLQRERHGTLLVDNTRKLDLYLLALWQDTDLLVPYSLVFDELRKPVPYFDKLGIRLPDVYDAHHGVSGLDRYRAALAHMAAHRRWSSAIFADNYSPFQRMAVEFFEDARVETLAMREYPGLRRIFIALHPAPVEGACNPETHSCLRHRLAMLSRALLDAPLAPTHGYQDAALKNFVQRFHDVMAQGESSTEEIAGLALSYVAKTRRQSDQLAKTFFTDTEVDFRDDNRHLWRFHELSDDEDLFEEHRQSTAAEDPKGLPPRHYPEWDYASQTYRPDWISLYERLHLSGNPADIDQLLAKHSALAKRLKRLLDLLKPQNKVRVRFQEEGSELDLDVAIRSLIDFKSGSNPDVRINMSHRTDGRNIAVMLLLDLSASLNEKPAGSDQTILQLSQEAVSLLAWSIDQLGDPFAIAGFQSNTRHDVRYLHIKGFGEQWDDEVKGRLAAMEAGYSTRMGAAMRHAAHYLGAQKAEKKLLLVLTDGRPSDVDVHDEQTLLADTRQAVQELAQKGIHSHCISLDPQADAYVHDIFAHHATMVDRVEQLPEKLSSLFVSLTK